MTKKNDTALRMAEFKQNLARKSAIPFNSSTPAKPVEPVKAEAPTPVAAPVAPAEPVKAEAPAPVVPPVAPVKVKAPVRATLKKADITETLSKSVSDGLISIQLSVSFNEAHHEDALLLAAKIGCSTEDIIKLVGKEIQVINVDPDDNKAEKRAGQSKRLSLKFNQSEIDNLRAEKDPLNVKTDLILVRNSVLNFFDSVAETVLADLKLKHGI